MRICSANTLCAERIYAELENTTSLELSLNEFYFYP